MSTDLPDRIGPYTVIARLDRKGPEPVYKVKGGDGRTLAVKLYAAGESEELIRLRLEAVAKASGLRHPALIRYEQAGEHEGRAFAAMELVPSTKLLGRALPLHRTLRAMQQIAEGLGYLHSLGMVHGCLNASRALVSLDGNNAKITESGMCPETSSAAMAATATMQAARLVRYLPPEMRRAAAPDPDPRGDIYSFGVLFYEVLTGKLPEGKFLLPSQESDEVPPELDEVVLRCLREDPAARYQTARELVKAIDRVRGSLPGGLDRHLEAITSTARGVLGGQNGPRGGRRWPALAVLGAAALVAGVFLMRACS